MRKQVRLLVVDDQADFCNMVREIVDLSGHVFEISCEFASNDKQARALMTTFEPSVVLLDAHLPEVNSFKMVSDYQHLPTQIVVTSRTNSTAIENAARSWGASGYAPKSSKIEEVERLVHEVAEMAPEAHRVH